MEERRMAYAALNFLKKRLNKDAEDISINENATVSPLQGKAVWFRKGYLRNSVIKREKSEEKE